KGLDGWMQTGEGKAKCHFLHVLKSPPDVLHKATGTYRISDDRIVVVNPDLRWLYFYDTFTHETRRLSPLSELKFVFGPNRGIHYPVEGEVTFEKNDSGDFAGLTLKRKGRQKALHATRAK